jgi:uncharacterized membrane protein
MTLPEDILIRVILFVLGLFGLWVARHVYIHKRSEEKPLVCMVGFDCDTVVHSDYAKFLGIHVEVLGIFYYGAVTFFYAFLLFLADKLPIMLTDFMILLSFTAFLFSVYLMSVQMFIIKKWCSWCIVSFLVSTAIFISTNIEYSLSDMFAIFLK